MNRVVGIGKYVISNKKEDVISTFSLGSCVAVTVYSPSRLVAGMIHIALPAKLISDNSSDSFGYYADVGLPIFVNEILYKYGCDKNDLIIGLYGGAASKKEDIFDIGPRNTMTIIKIFQSLKMYPAVNDTGGHISRTIHMSVMTGGVDTVIQPMII